jgi:hypothetical protein
MDRNILSKTFREATTTHPAVRISVRNNAALTPEEESRIRDRQSFAQRHSYLSNAY